MVRRDGFLGFAGVDAVRVKPRVQFQSAFVRLD